MKKYYVTLTIAFYLVIMAITSAIADDLSVEEIMGKSRTAENLPRQYTLVSNSGNETLTYVKHLPNGTLAKLSESSVSKCISILYDNKHYEIYLEQEFAFDMSRMIPKPDPSFETIFSDLNITPADQTIKLIGNKTIDGRDCYEVEERKIPKEKRLLLLEKLPDAVRDKFPAKLRYFIDKENFFVLVRESLTEEDSIISSSAYKNICVIDDLSDDLFQLPPGLEVITPSSFQEYLTIRTQKLYPPEPEQEEYLPDKLKAESDKRMEALQKKLQEEIKQQESESAKRMKALEAERIRPYDSTKYPLPQPSDNRWKAVSINAGIFILLLLIWLICRWIKK